MSLWFALAAFALAVITTAVLTMAPNPGESRLWTAVNTVAVFALFGLVPVINLLGTALGLAALVREKDRRRLGIAGLLVNAAAVVIAIVVIISVFRGLGAFQ